MIHRQLSFAQAAHIDEDVRDWFNQAFKVISPYWKGKVVGTGLTVTEQRILMPYLHGTETDDKDFRKKTELYFHEILTRVPAKGLKLEIGLEDNSLPLSDSNLPLNIQEYVVYRHALGYPGLAMSKDDADRSPSLKHFYLVDPDKVANTDLKINELEDKAIAAYFKYKDDELKVDQILTVLGTSLKNLSTADKVIKLKTLSKRNAEKGEHEQQQELQRFVDVCEDQDLAMKYLIQELIGAQILERIGTAIHMRESGDLLGGNAREAVLFLKNPKNSKVYNMLRGQYQSVVKKGSVLPEIPEQHNDEAIDAPAEVGRKKAKPITD